MGIAGGDPTTARRRYADSVRAVRADGLPALVRQCADGDLLKFAMRAADGAEVESVIIPMESYRGARWRTLCLSTQVGCRMGCTFCETGRMGLLRNLTASEIIAQRLLARGLLAERGEYEGSPYRYDGDGIRNLVFMGMGEPLDNFEQLARAIEILSDPGGLGFPLSHMTVSTVGVRSGLEKLAQWVRQDPQRQKLRLAISLHAADDELRSLLVPINRAVPLAELKQLLLAYPLTPRGLFLIQYVLLRGVNDSPEHARQLAAWCRDLPCVVNLIPYNPQRLPRYESPREETVLVFLQTLRQHGIFAKRRRTQGQQLAAACGQLATNTAKMGRYTRLGALSS
ncbi:MAG: 23S rRNA (adenine(2503)-C(2))-methyltransferase RlmN [Candidatus Binatia bacterium]|nr:23S rRNA (adenine(2503)-C(2))-methyltransferase RlmN [Candidatus Binatia bacterium]